MHFVQISVEFRNLATEYQDVISDICHRMGVGMAEFLDKKVGSMQEWDTVTYLQCIYKLLVEKVLRSST